MAVQAVLFDMGGTIETFNYTREFRLNAIPGLKERMASAGIVLPLTDEQLFEVVSSGLSRYHKWRLQSLQELNTVQIWRDYILVDYPVDQHILESHAEELMLYYESSMYQRTMRPEVPAVLEAVREMGLKIGLISNVSSRGLVPAKLKQYGIIHYFDPIVISSEYGRRKPDPAIFHYAARLAKTPASQCIYIGDRIARDIVGARKAGYYKAIQIRHDFAHGEQDTGATPDAVIHHMTELLGILEAEIHSPTNQYPVGSAIQGPVRAILFDAGDILYYRQGRGKKLAAFLKELSLSGEENHSVQRQVLSSQAYRGQISQDQYREALLRLYGVALPEDIERGKQILADEENDVRFFEGVPQTLAGLKEKGYLLGIITDTANPVHIKLNWFERGGFGNVWDSIISSQEIGVRKPHPDIYQAALQQLGLAAGQAVFVGHKASELDGARAIGMRTVAFNYDEAARADFYIHKFSDLLNISTSLNGSLPDKPEPTVWDISLSTMWAMKNPPALEDFFRSVRGMGIKAVELNHQVSSGMLAGIDLARYRISSIHEPCPAETPVDVLKARDWMISATGEANREQGVLAVKHSIDLAHLLGVKALVVHAGNVRAEWPAEKELYRLYRCGKKDTNEYLELKSQLVEQRASMAGPRLEAVMKSLLELLEYAAPLGVRLGLENRYHYMDIPILDEMEILLSLASPDHIGFWYDAGHAHTLDRLGFFAHEDWLARYAGRIIGVHLHDAKGIDDHGAPGEGEIDFNRISQYLPDDAIHTLELKGDITAEQLLNSLQYLSQKGCIRRLEVEP